MEKIAAVLGIAALCTLAFSGEGWAFRCGRGLVNVGDSTGKVLIECGAPTSKEVVGAKTKGKTNQAGQARKEKRVAGERGASRKVERWFYNCGDHDFIYVLTFSGGVLEKEETEGYGRGVSDCQGRR